MSVNMSEMMLNKVRGAVQAKTYDALERLAVLEEQLERALDEAEREAQARIAQESERVLARVEAGLNRLLVRIDDLGRAALEQVTEGVKSLAEAEEAELSGLDVPESPGESPEAAEADRIEADREEAAEPSVEHRTAAQVVRQEPPGFVPSASVSIEDAEAIEDPQVPDGPQVPRLLHEKRGRGRGVRYVPVEFPVPGNTYWVFGYGKRWQKVTA